MVVVHQHDQGADEQHSAQCCGGDGPLVERDTEDFEYGDTQRRVGQDQ